ncbi:MAG: hypothetical protein ACTHOJ_13080 [Sphingomonas oligoaromativorans]
MRVAQILILSAASAAIAAAGPPRGPNWVRVGSHVDGGPVEVDTRSIVPWGGLIRGWWRLTLAEPRPDGTVVERHLDAVDCARGLSTTLEQVTLRPDGSLVADARESPTAAIARLGPATPGTTGEMAVRAICRLRPPPKRTR